MREKSLKSRIIKPVIGLVFVLALVFSSLQIGTLTTYAAGFSKVEMSNPTFYASGCLKSLDILIQADTTYADAYGKIGIHTAKSSYDWDNRYTYDGSQWPATIGDSTLIAISTGEFFWSDAKEHSVKVEFTDGAIPCNQEKSYVVHLWTRADAYGVYTDYQFDNLRTSVDGKIYLGNNEIKKDTDSEAVNAVIEKINAIGTVENTEESKAKIEAARAAYEALTEEQKAKISAEQVKKLTDAEAEYKKLNTNHYEDVVISAGEVKDITGTTEAPAETNTYSATIKNDAELETLLNVTAAEKAQGVNVWLKVIDASATMPSADKEKINNSKGDRTVGLFLDASIFKKVGTNTEEKVHELNGKLKVSMIIPENLRKAGRTYSLIRVHDGVAEIIDGTYNAGTYTFTFETDKFSSYAILYKDTSSTIGSDDDNNDDDNYNNKDNNVGNIIASNNNGGQNTSNIVNKPATAQTATTPSPKTGDADSLGMWLSLAFISLMCGIAAASLYRKINQ